MRVLSGLFAFMLLAGNAVAGETGQFGWGIYASGVTVSGDHPWQERYRECQDRYRGSCEIDIPDPYCSNDSCSVIAIEWTVKYLLMQPPYDSDARDYAHNVQCTGTSNGRAKCFTDLAINAPFQHRHRRDHGLMFPSHPLLSPSLSETREAYWESHWFLPYPDPTVFYTYFNEGGKNYGLNYLMHGRNPNGLEGRLESIFPDIPLPGAAGPAATVSPVSPMLQPVLNSLDNEALNPTAQRVLNAAGDM